MRTRSRGLDQSPTAEPPAPNDSSDGDTDMPPTAEAEPPASNESSNSDADMASASTSALSNNDSESSSDSRDSESRSRQPTDESSNADDDSATDRPATRKRGRQASREKQELQRRAIQNSLMRFLRQYHQKGKFSFELGAKIPWGIQQKVKKDVNSTCYSGTETFNCSERQVSHWCEKVRQNAWRQTSVVIDYSRFPSGRTC